MSQLPSFFATNKPHVFNYIPRYWDPEKEEREKRIRQIELELGLHEGEAYVPRIRKGQMTTYFNRKSRHRERASNLRLIILIVFLMLVVYLLFFR
ncbi:MAG: hypothetical protein GXO83_13070 [Chlorobi bacterium]|nr:hypothetical protein [Chlorobiota bacterium]